MAIYVLNIDERSVRGRAFKTLLEQESAAKLLTMDEYDKAESDALLAKMGESAEEGLLSYEEAKAEFKRLRKRLAK